LLFLFSISLAEAQEGKLPPFRMMQPGGRIFKAEELPVGKAVLIFYFSTDCEVCHDLLKGILDKSADFRNVSVAMVTYQTVEAVSRYIVANNLNMYPNFYVGTEGNVFFLRKYYGITTFPYIALYTKDGDLVYKDFGQNIKAADLAVRVHKLK
jgi:thiol-disulfide isomerase/thioredoxin